MWPDTAGCRCWASLWYQSGRRHPGPALSEQEVLDAAEACKDKFSRLVLACLERI
ncbi:MAG: hypothetical protein ACLSAF_06680 [Intestinimonas sp.]